MILKTVAEIITPTTSDIVTPNHFDTNEMHSTSTIESTSEQSQKTIPKESINSKFFQKPDFNRQKCSNVPESLIAKLNINKIAENDDIKIKTPIQAPLSFQEDEALSDYNDNITMTFHEDETLSDYNDSVVINDMILQKNFKGSGFTSRKCRL